MAKLVSITVPSIYKDKNGQPKNLPSSMARLAEDAAATIPEIISDFEAKGALFRLSDAYRSKEEQDKAHHDYTSGKKKAYSPPSGQSMHEAGRAVDVDLATLIHPDSVPEGYETLKESEVRAVLKKHGWIPISNQGDEHSVDVKESWHFEFRGKFQKVYDNQFKLSGKHSTAYIAMAKAAIADLGKVGPATQPFDLAAKISTIDKAPEPAKPADEPKEAVTVKTTTEAGGETKTEKKEIAMTETSPTAKKLTIGAVITAGIGFLQQAWQTSQEATVGGIQYLLKHMPMILLILGILLFAYWIWKKAQDSRDARLAKIIDTNADPDKHDVVIT